MPLPRIPKQDFKYNGYCICVRSFDRTYVDKSSYDWKTIDVIFTEGELFEYTSTSGWFYELTAGSYKMTFEDTDFHDCFGRLSKEDYREYKLNKIIDNV
jgi:hypothetical protein